MVTNTLRWSLKERILRFLLEHKDNNCSILEISRALKSDYKNTFQAIKSFSKELIKMEKVGGSWVIKLNLCLNEELYSLDCKRTEEFLLNHPKLRIIQRDLKELAYPFVIVLVFGSYAKGEDNKNSDLDICVISDSSKVLNEVRKKFSFSTLNIEVQEFSTAEFSSMLEKRQNNLGHEIVKNNVLLYGIENYYNLISKWMPKE